MSKKKTFLVLTLFLTSFFHFSFGGKLDSLWSVWNNNQLPDTMRLRSLNDFAWEGYLYSQPDSAFYFAQLLYDFAKAKDLPKWQTQALTIQGNASVLKGEYFKGFELHNRSLAISEEIADFKSIANSLHSIGIIYYYQGNHPRALDYYLRSLEIRENQSDEQGISKSLNNIGIVYSEQKLFQNALDYFSRSLKLSEQMGDQRGVASALNNIGLIHKEMERLDSALINYNLSLKISEAIDDKRDQAAAYNNIGHIYEQWGNYSLALENFERSLKIKEIIGDKHGYIVSIINIGNIYQKQNNITAANKKCNEGLEFAKTVGLLAEQMKACDCLYRNYKLARDDNKALYYHELMLKFNDSLKNEETQQVLRQMEFTRQVMTDSIAKAEEKKQIQEAHELEVKKKNQTRNIFIGSTILLLIGAGGLYNRIRFIRKSRAAIRKEKDLSENLLLNILPQDVAKELKETGEATARKFSGVSILFTDFKDFTQQSSKLSPEALVAELNGCFRVFDAICEKYHIEKIKTIGDAYMVAGGLPVPSPDSAKNTVMAAIEMMIFMMKRKRNKELLGKFSFEMRAGIHTGNVVAGIVGAKKFQYDIWGDSVNLASRMESAGEPGKVNISRETFNLIKDDPSFRFESRGELMVKGKGCTEMYYVWLNGNQ